MRLAGSHGFCLWLFVYVSLYAISLPANASQFTQAQVKQLLIDEALSQEVSPALILAIAKVESNFNPAALSAAGARGIMQIMPATAWQGFKVSAQALYQPQTNVRVGVAYFKQLLEQYQGNEDIALSHYNGGSAVRQEDEQLRVIPATRDYLSKVKYYARLYQQADDDISGSAPRIRALQILQEHNLTRLLGADQTRQDRRVPDDSAYSHAIDTQPTGRQRPDSRQAVRSYRDTLLENSSLYFADKQQKVNEWEAIFN